VRLQNALRTSPPRTAKEMLATTDQKRRSTPLRGSESTRLRSVAPGSNITIGIDAMPSTMGLDETAFADRHRVETAARRRVRLRVGIDVLVC